MSGKPGPARPHRFDMKLSDEDRAQLDAGAVRNACSASDYVRLLLRQDASRVATKAKRTA